MISLRLCHLFVRPDVPDTTFRPARTLPGHRGAYSRAIPIRVRPGGLSGPVSGWPMSGCPGREVE